MTDDSVRDAVAQTYRTESRRVLATLIRLLGDFDIAEEMMHEAFAAALSQWPGNGVPSNPGAWLVSTARFKAVDILRRRARFDGIYPTLLDDANNKTDAVCDVDAAAEQPHSVEDDHLRLIFMCCHPAISPDAQVALTLREVCGLTTEEVAHAFLVGAPTVAQRIVRAKAKIRDAHIPFEIPPAEALDDRLHNVLHVIYLVFNEGYSASYGDTLQRLDLVSEAIRLARLFESLKQHRDTRGLLALMLLHDARRSARTSADGELILLEDQDRTQWNTEQIGEGVRLVEDALTAGSLTSHTIQAAIAAIHCEAVSAAETDWSQIVALYDVLLTIEPSAVIELNRAVAVAMRDGPETAIPSVDESSRAAILPTTSRRILFVRSCVVARDVLTMRVRPIVRRSHSRATHQRVASLRNVSQKSPEYRHGMIRVQGFAVSIDGFSAGPDQSLDNPLGVNGPEMMQWFFPTHTWRSMNGLGEGERGVDNEIAEQGMSGNGAYILGRNMFGPVRGPWPDENWKGWWGDEPPYHVPTFVLTHHARAPIDMQGGTRFIFVTGGIQEALERAQEAAGDKHIRIGGGASTVRQYLKARLIDELHLVVSPVLLGRGEALFAGLDMRELGYTCTRHVAGERAMHVFLQKT